MSENDILNAASIVVDTILGEDIDLMSVGEILADEREGWVFYDQNDRPYHLAEETEEEAVQIREKAQEIMDYLRDRVEMFSE